MDKTIRRNEVCVIGLPRCDFVFSSTRTCFIAYGYEESPLEMSLLRKLLEERSIQAIEAGGALAPGQNAFCSKICSKIITAQFCAVLLNNEMSSDREIPNANVNMEYGLMLGFNKYVIPFQRESQKLPFNVAGLDTIKYGDRDFERRAAAAIDQAISETQQVQPATVSLDQNLSTFLLSRKAIVASLNDQGDKNIFDLGMPLGFNLLHDFAGMNYIFFGNFTMLRPDAILWRIRLLVEILDGRTSSLPLRVETGIVSLTQVSFLAKMLANVQIWILVTSEEDKELVLSGVTDIAASRAVSLFSLMDVSNALTTLPGTNA